MSHEHHHHRHAHQHPEDTLLTVDVHFEIKHEQNFHSAHDALINHVVAAPAGIAHFAIAYGADEHGVSIAVVREGFHNANAWITYAKASTAETTALGEAGRRTLIEFVGTAQDIAKAREYFATLPPSTAAARFLVLAPGGLRM